MNVVKSTQEQAVAAWTAQLNQLRLQELLEFIQKQDGYLSEALEDLDWVLDQVQKLKESNRGGNKGMHGFIAEVAEVGIGNAREKILGQTDIYEWVNDNGVVDLTRDGVDIQQKFYNAHLSLNAIKKHFEKYPDFLNNGAKYQIPKDQHDRIKYLLSVSEEEANKLPTSDGSFSLREWRYVHKFFSDESNGIPLESVEPSILEYREVQREQINTTIRKEKASLLKTDKNRRAAAQQKSRGTLREGVKVTAVAAGIEGGTTLCLAIRAKQKDGKALKDFDSDDWTDVLKSTGAGTAKGGIRGSAVYALTNAFNNRLVLHTQEAVKAAEIANKANAAAASAMVTAAFGVAEQAHLLRERAITQQQFIENSEMLCLETSISAVSAFLGQAAIPIPVVGAVVGNAVGTTLLKIATDSLNTMEQELVQEYLCEIEAYGKSLDQQYQELLEKINREYAIFLELIEALYAVDVKEAFEGSVAMAKYCGVPGDEILDSKEKIDNYFLG